MYLFHIMIENKQNPIDYLNHYKPTILPFYLEFLIQADFLVSL